MLVPSCDPIIISSPNRFFTFLLGDGEKTVFAVCQSTSYLDHLERTAPTGN